MPVFLQASNENRIIHSFDKSIIYYLGIIDFFTGFEYFQFFFVKIQTFFSFKKKGEYFFKKMIFGPTISALPPQNYSERFQTFISELLSEH